MLASFFAWNTRYSKALEKRFNWETDQPFWEEFSQLVASAASAVQADGVVVDIGGGRRCIWIDAVPNRVHVVAVDIDPDELAANPDVEDCRVGDVSKGLPLAESEADLIVSRALLEHVDGVPDAVRFMARALKPGGRTLHLVPARYSLFGLAARLGPFQTLRNLLHLAKPESKGQVEFPVFYDHCTATDLTEAFRNTGFRTVNVRVCYAQSNYFYAVIPLFLVVTAYQYAIKLLGVRRLAAYLIVDATR